MKALTGTGQKVRLILRLDRVRLPLWILAVLGIVVASASAVQGLYDTPQARAGYALTAQSPAAIVLSGPPQAVDSVGGITVFEINLTSAVGVALMAIFLTIRHTRAEEEAGRTELLSAGVLGRHAPLTAALVVVGGGSLLLGLLLGVCLVALGLPASGSLLFGAGVAMLGLFFTTLAAVAAQVGAHARAALGIALAVLGAAWALRSLGDVRGNVLSWLSPVGWTQATRPFGEERWWPLALPLIAALVLAVLAVVLERHRDLGGGLIPSRPGAPRASRALSSVLGLAWRQQGLTVFWWSVGLLLMGMLFGAVADDIARMLDDTPVLVAALGPDAERDLIAAYFGMVLAILALVAACFTVSSVHRLYGEEGAARAEYVLSTPTARPRWQFGWLAVTAVGTVVVLLATGAGVAITDALVSGTAERAGGTLGATLAYLPAVGVIGGLAATLHGWLPRLSALAWVVLAACFVISWLGRLLGFPSWVMNLSPFTITPQLPLEEMDWSAVAGLTALAVGLVVLAAVGLRRRDIGADG